LLDEVEEGGLAPLDVVEDADERLLASGRFEQLAYREGDLLGGIHRLFGAQQSTERREYVRVERQLFKARLELPQDLYDGPVRNSLAQGDTAAAHDVRAREGADELVCEARLADAGRAEDGHECTGAIAYGVLERVEQAAELLLAPDHRYVEAALAGRLAVDGDQPPRGYGFAFSFHRKGLERLRYDPMPNERERVFAQEDLVRGCSLLEPRGEVDGVTGGEPLGGSSHDLARVDADPQREPGSVLGRELLVQPGDGVA
jgi:hypothetical protein